MINEVLLKKEKNMKYSSSLGGLQPNMKKVMDFLHQKPNMRSTINGRQFSKGKVVKRKKNK